MHRCACVCCVCESVWSVYVRGKRGSIGKKNQRKQNANKKRRMQTKKGRRDRERMWTVAIYKCCCVFFSVFTRLPVQLSLPLFFPPLSLGADLTDERRDNQHTNYTWSSYEALFWHLVGLLVCSQYACLVVLHVFVVFEKTRLEWYCIVFLQLGSVKQHASKAI